MTQDVAIVRLGDGSLPFSFSLFHSAFIYSCKFHEYTNCDFNLCFSLPSPHNSHQIPPSMSTFGLQAFYLKKKKHADSSLCYLCAIVLGWHWSTGNLPKATAPKENNASLPQLS